MALILAIEAVVGLRELDLTAPPRLEWRQSRWAASRWARGSDVLGLGTSMTKLGLHPAPLEGASGLRAYNLAACAGRLPGSYYLLRRALASGARPRAVVLEVHPSYLATSFREGLVAWPDLLGPAEMLDLAWSSGDASFFASTATARLLPSLAARSEIRSAVASALRGEPASFRAHTVPHLRNLAINRGAFVRRNQAPYRGEVAPYLEAMYLAPAWAPDPLNERYLRRTLDLCGSQGIRVFWMIPPMTPALQDRREQTGLEAAYTRFAERISADYPNLFVLDARKSRYPVEAFSDAAHLVTVGASSLSADVGRAIRDRLDRQSGAVPRWVDLPTYRARPIDGRLEDIAESYRSAAGSVRR